MEITCYRDHEVAREPRALPAAIYNLAIVQLARSPSGCLFVPIRSMQYLAILSLDEFMFIDGQRKNWIDISWRRFKPQLRNSLNEPVQYEVVYYRPDYVGLMLRLQSEFYPALRALAEKTRPQRPGQLVEFPVKPLLQ
jgi:hypothetical protein